MKYDCVIDFFSEHIINTTSAGFRSTVPSRLEEDGSMLNQFE